MAQSEGGYLARSREGRRNRYEVNPALPLRHAIERHRDVGALFDVLLASPKKAGARR